MRSKYGDLATLSARCLASLVGQDGKFVYRQDALLGHRLSGYNLVRHSACAWAMNVTATELRRGQTVHRAARRAMDWLVSNSIVPIGPWSLGVVENETIKLGANALAILALVSLPDFSSHDRALVVGLCNYIRSQKRRDGNFFHQRKVTTDKIKDFHSSYYTGEALFAMLVASDVLLDEEQYKWSEATLRDLIGIGYGINQQSHWMMYAVEACHRRFPRREFLEYADRLVDQILQRPWYRLRKQCTPIACRTEAMLLYLRMWSSGTNEIWRCSHARDVRAAIDQNLHLQLRDWLPGGLFREGAGSNVINRLSSAQYAELFVPFDSVAERFVTDCGKGILQIAVTIDRKVQLQWGKAVFESLTHPQNRICGALKGAVNWRAR